MAMLRPLEKKKKVLPPHLATGGATQLAAMKDECGGQSSPFGSTHRSGQPCDFASGRALTYVVTAISPRRHPGSRKTRGGET
jgi:hypothetical protein